MNIKYIRLLVGFLFVACLNNFVVASQPLDKIVAIVDNDIITNSELEQHKKLVLSNIDLANTSLPSENILKKQILNQMILTKLQLQLANDTGIEVSAENIDSYMQDMASGAGLTVTALQNDLKSQGVSLAEFRTNLQHEIAINQLRQREIARNIVISNADIDGFLSSPVGQDRSGTEYHLRHIVLSISDTPTPQAITKAKLQAETIVSDLKHGADFAKMAMTKSSGQQALHGGDLGWRRISEIPTLFIKHAPTMQINEIVGPIQSANGFHIIKLVEKRIGKTTQHLETHVRQILIKSGLNTSDAEAEKRLLAIRKQILAGKDFATLARRKSEELNTASQGGDLGWLTAAAVLPTFYSKMQTLKNGELSLPFKTDMGWHLIQVLDRRSHNSSLDATRNRAKDILRERKLQEMLEAWLKRLRDNAKVEILL